MLRNSRKTITATKHTIYRSQKNSTKINKTLWELDQNKYYCGKQKECFNWKSTITKQGGPQNFVCLQMKRISTKASLKCSL